MSKTAQEKILVPVDGSDRAINTVKYIARNEPFHNMRIVLFHVFSAVPESYWDMENNISTRAIAKQARAWEQSQKKLAIDHMERAKGLLEKSGIPGAAIQMEIQRRKKGIARDIVNEAKSGYDTIVMGRRGLSGIKDFFLGSISQKVLNLARDVSIVLVD